VALDGLGDERHASAALTPGKRPGTHCIEGWLVVGPIWTDVENLGPNRDSLSGSPNLPSARRYTDYALSRPTAILIMDLKGGGIIETDWI
jgi:hypothetical protein